MNPTMRIKKRFLKDLLEELEKGEVKPYQVILAKSYKSETGKDVSSEFYATQGRDIVNQLNELGYIEQIPGRNYESYKLTSKGSKEALKDIGEMKLPTLNVFDFPLRYELMKRTFDDYKSGNFENVIFNSMKMLEEKVREKAKLRPNDIGVKLMSKALGGNKGILVHSNIEVEDEQEGIHHMFRGAMGYFKNPSSHRTVDWNDPNLVNRVLVFIDLLLSILDECNLRNQKIRNA